MLRLLKRHTQKCLKDHPGISKDDWKGQWRRCRCPISATGSLRIDGAVRMKSTGETKWEAAEEVINSWEKAGTTRAATQRPHGAPAGYVSIGKREEDGTYTTGSACEEFREGYVLAAKLKLPTAYKYDLMMRSLSEWAEINGIKYVQQLDLGQLQKHQATWKLGAKAAIKRIEQLRTFLDYCVGPEVDRSEPGRRRPDWAASGRWASRAGGSLHEKRTVHAGGDQPGL